MGVLVLTCPQIQKAWGFSSDTQSTQAFDPWFRKLVLLAEHYPTELIQLVAEAMCEADQRRFEECELPVQEAIKLGRIDRSRLRPHSRR